MIVPYSLILILRLPALGLSSGWKSAMSLWQVYTYDPILSFFFFFSLVIFLASLFLNLAFAAARLPRLQSQSLELGFALGLEMIWTSSGSSSAKSEVEIDTSTASESSIDETCVMIWVSPTRQEGGEEVRSPEG